LLATALHAPHAGGACTGLMPPSSLAHHLRADAAHGRSAPRLIDTQSTGPIVAYSAGKSRSVHLSGCRRRLPVTAVPRGRELLLKSPPAAPFRRHGRTGGLLQEAAMFRPHLPRAPVSPASMRLISGGISRSFTCINSGVHHEQCRREPVPTQRTEQRNPHGIDGFRNPCPRNPPHRFVQLRRAQESDRR